MNTFHENEVKSKGVIAHNFGMAQATLSTFLKNEDKLQSKLVANCKSKTTKKVRRPKFSKLN